MTGLGKRRPGQGPHGRFYRQTASMVLSPRMKAFDLSDENLKIRAAYGETAFGNGCLLARRLVQAGVTFVEVRSNGCDTHQQSAEKVGKNAGSVDPGFASLVADLKSKGMLEKTLVIWMGEFGRTPKINPSAGRDHFPRVFNVALAGGGVKGGQIIATVGRGDRGQGQPGRRQRPFDQHLPHAENRPGQGEHELRGPADQDRRRRQGGDPALLVSGPLPAWSRLSKGIANQRNAKKAQLQEAAAADTERLSAGKVERRAGQSRRRAAAVDGSVWLRRFSGRPGTWPRSLSDPEEFFFVGRNDPANFLENPDFRGLGWTQIRWAWTTRLLGVYQPFSWMLLEAQYAICGLEPRGYHLTSLILNLPRTRRKFYRPGRPLLLRRCRPEEPARHPRDLHGEYWAWAVATVPAASAPGRGRGLVIVPARYLPWEKLFMMLAVLAITAHPAGGAAPPGLVNPRSDRSLQWSCACCARRSPCSPPLVLLILDVYPLGRLGLQRGRLFGRASWSCWLEKVPYLVLAALFAAIAVSTQAGDERRWCGACSLPTCRSGSPRHAGAGVWIYLLMTLWPSGTAGSIIPMPAAPQWDGIQFVLARWLLVGYGQLDRAAAVLPRLARGLVKLPPDPGAELGPGADRLPDGRRSVRICRHDRNGPSAGRRAGHGAAADRSRGTSRPPGFVLATLGVEIGLTRRHGDLARFYHIMDMSATSRAADSRVLNNLGYSLILDGRPAEAIPYLTRSLELGPRSTDGRHSLGMGAGGRLPRRRSGEGIPGGASPRSRTCREPSRPRSAVIPAEAIDERGGGFPRARPVIR